MQKLDVSRFLVWLGQRRACDLEVEHVAERVEVNAALSLGELEMLKAGRFKRRAELRDVVVGERRPDRRPALRISELLLEAPRQTLVVSAPVRD